MRDIAITNNDIFSVKTDGGAKVKLFDELSQFITDPSKRDAFCVAIINKLIKFSFERIFTQKYDFYATIFEYPYQGLQQRQRRQICRVLHPARSRQDHGGNLGH